MNTGDDVSAEELKPSFNNEELKPSFNNESLPPGVEGIAMGTVSGRGDLRYARVAASNEDDHSSGEDVQSMGNEELKGRLETVLCDIISRVGGDLKPPIDPNVPLISLGLDSMSIVQFKGVLDNRFLVVVILHFFPEINHIIILIFYETFDFN